MVIKIYTDEGIYGLVKQAPGNLLLRKSQETDMAVIANHLFPEVLKVKILLILT